MTNLLHQGRRQIGLMTLLAAAAFGIGCDRTESTPLAADNHLEKMNLQASSRKTLKYREFVVIKGTLNGQWIRQPSGERYGELFKGCVPVRLTYPSGMVPLFPETAEIGERLVDSDGKEVEIEGRVDQAFYPARGASEPQQGMTGPTPDFELYFVVVSSCKVLDAAESN